LDLDDAAAAAAALFSFWVVFVLGGFHSSIHGRKRRRRRTNGTREREENIRSLDGVVWRHAAVPGSIVDPSGWRLKKWIEVFGKLFTHT